MSDADRRSALEGVNRPGETTTSSILVKRRAYYLATTIALALLMLVAVGGPLVDRDVLGVDSGHVRASADGYLLEVQYATASRGGLATPLVIEVTREGGFAEPVVIGIDHRYMQMWDENGFYPTPSAERTMGDLLIWEFDPPDGDRFRFTYDGRIEPAVQSGRDGRVAVMEANVPVVEVDIATRVLP